MNYNYDNEYYKNSPALRTAIAYEEHKIKTQKKGEIMLDFSDFP